MLLGRHDHKGMRMISGYMNMSRAVDNHPVLYPHQGI